MPDEGGEGASGGTLSKENKTMTTTTRPPTTQTPTELLPPSSEFAWPTAPVEARRLVQYFARRARPRASGTRSAPRRADWTPGRPDFDHIDCSGWVRAAIAWASGGRLVVSRRQRKSARMVRGARAEAQRLREPDAGRRDRAHRVHPPQCSSSKSATFISAFDGRTMESWGGHGPGSRSPLAHVLHAFTTDVFVLAVPGMKLPRLFPRRRPDTGGRAALP